MTADSRPPGRRWTPAAYGFAAGLVVAGVVVWVALGRDIDSYGWFAYAPLSEEVPAPSGLSSDVAWNRSRVVAGALFSTGLVVAALAGGRVVRARAGAARPGAAPVVTLVVGTVALVSGLAGLHAFAQPTREMATVAISNYPGPTASVDSFTRWVWTPAQHLAAGLALAGLLLVVGAASYGLFPSRASSESGGN